MRRQSPPSGFVVNSLLGSSALLNNIMLAFPQLGLGAVRGTANLKNKLLELIADPAVHELLFTAILQQLGATGRAEDYFKGKILPDGTYQSPLESIIQTPGYKGESIAAGAYQKTMGKTPPENILPKYEISDFQSAINTIVYDKSLSTTNRIAKLNQAIEYWDSITKGFGDFMNLVR